MYSILIEGLENGKSLNELLNDFKTKAKEFSFCLERIAIEVYYLKEQQTSLEHAISEIQPKWDQAKKSFTNIMWDYLMKINKRYKNIEPSRILVKIREKVCEMYDVSYKNWWFFQESYFNRLSFYSVDTEIDDLCNKKFVILDLLVAKMKKSKYFEKCKCEETLRIYRWALAFYDLICKNAQLSLLTKILKLVSREILLKQSNISNLNKERERIEKFIIKMQIQDF
ncbi:unnamed protein product [Blepharisma stoltei]|uniref:Uncharacterized protein n=1 Tax=Blepharisma stoltei TaxID=1481888 RepID=A0AAU9K7S9_9CILI|nr:unnamed protein product [Blepharisma stoltei]